jgi:Protein of unknown function (DUF2802)
MSMTFTTIAAVSGAVLGFLGLVSALITIRTVQSWRERCAAVEASLAAVSRELELVASISAKAGRRAQRVEQECSGVADRIDQVELRGGARALDQAIDFARRGADPVKLTQQFGLSRSEADLVTRLHGRKKIA